MSKILQFSGLLGVSAAAHVMLFLGAAPHGGTPSGAGGTQDVTLAAAPPQLAQMVQDWTRPVEVQGETAALRPPPVSDLAPATVVQGVPTAPGTLPLPLQVTQAEQTPDPVTPPAPVAPPAPPAPVPPMVRPSPRPTPQPVAQAPTPVAQPAAKPAPAAPAQPAQRAAGAGGGASAGTAQSAGDDAPSAAHSSKLIARWSAGIRARIERRKRYPSGTRASGQVQVQMTISTTGAVIGARVRSSSGDATLDRAALQAVQNARLPKAPKGLPPGQHGVTLTLTFAR